MLHHLILFIACFELASTINYVTGGSFQLPTLNPSTFQIGGATDWTGQNFYLISQAPWIGYGQFIDLQSQSGYIQQTVTLPNASQCNLSYYQSAPSSNLSSYIMDIKWNGVVLATKIPDSPNTTFQSLLLCGNNGSNVLRFQSRGNLGGSDGMYLDEVRLDCDGVTQCPQVNTKSQSGVFIIMEILAGIFSLPSNSFHGLKHAYLFLEDLWLYHYDKRQHQGVLEVIFNVTATIQSLKFRIFDKIFHWQKLTNFLPLSDYTPFTRKKFVQIESTSSVLIKATFGFFIYTIPENILTCLALYFLFRLLKQYQISKLIRKFYFIKSVLLQTLIEGNIAYFTYVSLGHLSNSFSFNFYDKLSLAFCLFFFLAVLLFGFTYYPLAGQFLKKKSCYFISNYYRCSQSYFFLTVKNLGRNFLRGAIFYFLHQHYSLELLLLALVEVIVIVTAVIIESTKKIFISKESYCLCLVYHFLLIFLNFTLYWSSICGEFDANLKQIVISVQQLLIYLIIANLALAFIVDILPLNLFQAKKFQALEQQSTIKSQKLRENRAMKKRWKNEFQFLPKRHKNRQKVMINNKEQIKGQKKQHQIRRQNQQENKHPIITKSKRIVKLLLVIKQTPQQNKQ